MFSIVNEFDYPSPIFCPSFFKDCLLFPFADCIISFSIRRFLRKNTCKKINMK